MWGDGDDDDWDEEGEEEEDCDEWNLEEVPLEGRAWGVHVEQHCGTIRNMTKSPITAW